MFTYKEARDQIRTGDVISVRETHGFLTPFTKFFTRSPYTHSGIAIWLAGGLWMAELNAGKNHLIPLSQISEVDFDVYDCPVDRDRVELAILESLRVKVPYSFLILFVVGFINFFGIMVFLHARKLLECAGYCVSILEQAGWPERSRVLSPADLARQLTIRFQVRG